MNEPEHRNRSSPAPKSSFQQWLRTALSRPWPHVLAGAGVLLIDYATGKFIMFPILFVLPVMLAAWFSSKRTAYVLAVVLPLGRLVVASNFDAPDPLIFLSINALIRMAVLVLLAFLVARTARQTKELDRRVRQLEGILPICMFCKRIRDDHDNWHQLESYITDHSGAFFSHGICADCQKKHYGEYS